MSHLRSSSSTASGWPSIQFNNTSMFSSGGLVSSKFSHLSTAIRASGRSNPISINMVTIGGVGDLATGGGGGGGGGGRGGASGGRGGAGGGIGGLAGSRGCLVARKIFLGGKGGAGGTTPTGGAGGPVRKGCEATPL